MGTGGPVADTIANAIARDFGSVDRWRGEFIALGEALAGDSGWILLTYVPRDGRLINQSASDHAQSIVGGIPILALDMYEHAYHIEFGANTTRLHRGLHAQHPLAAVEARYTDAMTAAPPRGSSSPSSRTCHPSRLKRFRRCSDAGQRVQIIDTRPRHYSTRAHDIVEGAVWRDPERIEEWIGDLSKDEPVVTFCVYGFHIGCQSAKALRKAGFDARYMAGGHYAWKAIKGPVKLFE